MTEQDALLARLEETRQKMISGEIPLDLGRELLKSLATDAKAIGEKTRTACLVLQFGSAAGDLLEQQNLVSSESLDALHNRKMTMIEVKGRKRKSVAGYTGKRFLDY